MKRTLMILTAWMAALPGLTACGADSDPVLPGTEITPSETPDTPSDPDPEPSAGIRLRTTIGSAPFTAILADHAATRAFRALLPLTVTMEEMNGNEKFAYLPRSLPTAPSAPGTIRRGDVMLYGSDCLVLFYKTFSTSYRYTPLGRIEDTTGLARAVGSGRVTVTFERVE